MKFSKTFRRLVIIFSLFVLLFIIFKIASTSDANAYSINDQITVSHGIEDERGLISTGVQQIMIGKKCGSYKKAEAALKAIKDAGYDGIELNDFMIHRTSVFVKLLTGFSGMPVGNGGKLNWPLLIENSGLKVISLHTNLNRIEANAEEVANEAKCFNCKKVVITGVEKDGYILNYCKEAQHEVKIVKAKKIGESRAGTGDVFSAIIAADAINGEDFYESVKKANDFLMKCIKRSMEYFNEWY